jgi:hypothetical protein
MIDRWSQEVLLSSPTMKRCMRCGSEGHGSVSCVQFTQFQMRIGMLRGYSPTGPEPVVSDWALRLVRQKQTNSKYAFDINALFVQRLWDKQGGLCYWFGVPMVIKEPKSPKKKRHSLQQPSLDRIDCSWGYTQDNVVLCCLAANLCRNNNSPEEFETFVSLVKRSPTLVREK